MNVTKGIFGIAQGGLYKDLREESIKKLVEIADSHIGGEEE